MECPICSFDFDGKTRKPLLCICGNSICIDCVELLIIKHNGAFNCPLCRYSRNNYRSNPLPENKQIVKLMIELSDARFPTKEKSELTEALIFKNSEVQSSDNEKPKEFNEYVTVIGILFLVLLYIPWVINN